MKLKATAGTESKGNLDRLLGKLAFQPEDILMAAAEQPELFRKAVDYRISRFGDRIGAKARLEEGWASRSLKIRKDYRNEGDKLTEANLGDLLRADPAMQVLQAEMDKAEIADEYAKLLLEAYRMRRDSLRVVADMASSGIMKLDLSEAAMARLKDAKAKLRAKYPGGA